MAAKLFKGFHLAVILAGSFAVHSATESFFWDFVATFFLILIGLPGYGYFGNDSSKGDEWDDADSGDWD